MSIGRLRSAHAEGGFGDETYRLLDQQPVLLGDLVGRILDTHFPEMMHDDIRQALGLDTRSRDFSKVTAIAGLLANALDLAQHVLHPFAPSLSGAIMMLMGPLYLVWFPMLARDFFRLANR